ncbi:hypothetical protein PAECIP111893_01228 [Paenibacillus plantiphilus]|uniref:Uncharacterized protein n=1 Tax=Paenibacillus plantiphilus TaxID=2905650 RepID=A0ABM9C0V8_9BACL|nr:hypothetical protein PAECIP111893_01228 [Paenibacillus plantiphilus]
MNNNIWSGNKIRLRAVLHTDWEIFPRMILILNVLDVAM